MTNVRRLGGQVELVGESYQETQAYALQRAATDGLVFVPPYDDPLTVAGQGTIGDEILRQVCGAACNRSAASSGSAVPPASDSKNCIS